MKDIRQIEPWINSAELDELSKVIQSEYITESQYTKQFERLTVELTGSPYATAICNGTCALFCALKAIGIGPGDEVIVPNITFIATATAVLLTGASVHIVDVNPETGCIDYLSAASAITPMTKAIMPVHLYGIACEMDELVLLASKNNLTIIEDAAQGVGVFYKGRHVGTMGRFGILSYYGNKTITTGEGGIVLSKALPDSESIYRLKNHGRAVKGTFIHDSIGWNFSFTEMQAAIGVAQMKKLRQILQEKDRIFDFYSSHISHELIAMRKVPSTTSEAVNWFSNVQTHDAAQLEVYLKERDIPSRRVFYPLNRQPAFLNQSEIRVNSEGEYPGSDYFYNSVLSLPSKYGLEADQLEYICDAINNFS